MRFFRLTTIMLLIGSLEACVYTEKVSGNFVTMLKEPESGLVKKVRMDGAYHFIQKEHLNYPTEYINGKPTKYIDTPYLDGPVFFFDNGVIMYDYAFTLDSIQFRLYQQKNNAEKHAAFNYRPFYFFPPVASAFHPFSGAASSLLPGLSGLPGILFPYAPCLVQQNPAGSLAPE